MAHEPTTAAAYMDRLFERAADVFINGSLMDVLSFNTFDGQSAKCLWVFNNFRYLQLLGLFIAGMLIGRQGIHKSEEKMVKYSRLFLPYSGFLGSILCCCLSASGMGSGRVCVAGRTDSFQDVWQSGTDDGLFLRFHFAVLSV